MQERQNKAPGNMPNKVMCKWIAEQALGGVTETQNLLRAMKEGEMWRAITEYVLKGHDIEDDI